MRYKKAKSPINQPAAPSPMTLGMLYVVNVRLLNKSGELIKHRILLVGCEEADIERKMRWMFDAATYKEMSITDIEKVREKVHYLSSVITRLNEPQGPSIERSEGSLVVQQGQRIFEEYDPKLYAVGVTTTMLGKDQKHALRKVGHALISRTLEGKSHSGAHLSDDANIQIEEIPKSNRFAKPRDVSNETNSARFVRG